MTKNNDLLTSIRAGSVRAAVWRNESREGTEYLTVSLSRTYKDGEKWKESNTYNREELLRARVVIDKALELVCLDVKQTREASSFTEKIEEEREAASELEIG